VAFYHAAGRVVFSGDVLFQQGIGRTDLPGGHYPTLMSSLRAVLLPLPDDTTVFTTIGEEKRDNPFLAD
jgi:glyoxylase-like metal-dependent hydrolase (beta-lactamase superfamily II)